MTTDVGTILRELEVQHSAAEMIIMASPGQELGEPVNSGICWSLPELAGKLSEIGLTFARVIEV